MITELESGLSALGWTVRALGVLGKDGVRGVFSASMHRQDGDICFLDVAR